MDREEKEIEKRKEIERIEKEKDEFEVLFQKIVTEFLEHRLEDALEAKNRVMEYIKEKNAQGEVGLFIKIKPYSLGERVHRFSTCKIQ